MGVLARAYEGARLGRRTEGWVAAGHRRQRRDRPGDRPAPRPLARSRPQQPLRRQGGAARWSATWSAPGCCRGRGRRRRSWPRRPTGSGRRSPRAADADGLTDFAGLQALIVRSLVESGEVLVRLRERRVEDGLPVPLQLQVLEADHLDSGRPSELRDGGFVLQGIEFDALGRRRAYWLYPTHPGDGRGALVSHRVPADRVLHLFERLRPGQVRGVPWFAPVMLKLRDLDAYDEAELVRKKIEACFAAFVTGVAGRGDPRQGAHRGRRQPHRDLRARDDRVPRAGARREVRRALGLGRLRRVHAAAAPRRSPPASGSPTSC